MMRRVLVLLLVCVALVSGCAAAEQEVLLPGGRYVLDVPDWMEYSDPVDGDAGVEAYISEDLEMDFIMARKEDLAMIGMAADLREIAKAQRAAGNKPDIRKINGIEVLCFRTEDEDGTPCIGYVIEDGEWIIRINFWYATQDAANETKKIMETIREINS